MMMMKYNPRLTKAICNMDQPLESKLKLPDPSPGNGEVSL